MKSVNFRDKEYPVIEQFARGEAQLLTEQQLLTEAGSDNVAKVDALVNIVNLLTGIDKGDLNGTHLRELSKLASDTMDAYKEAFPAPPSGDAGNVEAPAS